MLAAAEAIVDVGVHHPAVADVVLVMIPTPVAPGMDPLPANPAELDKSPTSIRCSLISRCKRFEPVPRAVCSVFDAAGRHFRACPTTYGAVQNFVDRHGFTLDRGGPATTGLSPLLPFTGPRANWNHKGALEHSEDHSEECFSSSAELTSAGSDSLEDVRVAFGIPPSVQRHNLGIY